MAVAWGRNVNIGASEARANTSQLGPLQQITPVVTVGTGREAGQPWKLTAYVATGTSVEGVPTDALCIDWAFPAEAAAGPEVADLCHMGFSTHLATAKVIGPISHFNDGDPVDPPMSAFFALTSTDAVAVEANLLDGSAVPVSMYGPFPELAGARGFVAFAPPLESVHFRGRSEAGLTIWEQKVALTE